MILETMEFAFVSQALKDVKRLGSYKQDTRCRSWKSTGAETFIQTCQKRIILRSIFEEQQGKRSEKKRTRESCLKRKMRELNQVMRRNITGETVVTSKELQYPRADVHR